MRANSMCMSCMLSRQEKQIRQFSDENKKSEYLHQILELLYHHGQEESAPWLAERMNRLYESFWGELKDYTSTRHKYNQLLLAKEAEIEQKMRNVPEPLKECIKYVCAANYIDFSAVPDVNEQTFGKLLQKAGEETVDAEEYQRFRDDLEKADSLAYLVDNCGEIVLDKVFIKLLKEYYPKLKITVVVRGENVINDATLEDAREVGLTEMVPCIGNGNAAPGTVLSCLNEEARELLYSADVIVSKGQGNFESLFNEGLNPYYFFLCKCELFVRRFGLGKYASIFKKEERIQKE